MGISKDIHKWLACQRDSLNEGALAAVHTEVGVEQGMRHDQGMLGIEL